MWSAFIRLPDRLGGHLCYEVGVAGFRLLVIGFKILLDEVERAAHAGVRKLKHHGIGADRLHHFARLGDHVAPGEFNAAENDEVGAAHVN